ncbi:MAG: hypothetical protein NT069_20195, partial [Planctomycetota bacterium]|nr:hypothetical protein [Planctomycetota bacterium]
TSSRNYATRVANIGGTGSGPRRNSGYFLKGSGPWQTVFDDGSKDTLTGGAGLDWYFGNFIGSGLLDTLTDGAGSETKSDL